MMGVIGVMGDAVAIGDLACITSYERWGVGWGVGGTREQERERSGAGRGKRGERKGEGIKEEGREYQ